MKVELIQHSMGERIPLIMDEEGLPVPILNEWLLSRRNLSGNTLTRNARELVLLAKWLNDAGIELRPRLRSDRMFTEAELNGGLIEKLRHSVSKSLKNRKDRANNLSRIGTGSKRTPVGEETFNQRLTTARSFLVWAFGIELGSLSSEDPMFARVRQHRAHVERILDKAFIAHASPVSAMRKSLTADELQSLKKIVHYKNTEAIGTNKAVKFRNYICAMIMLMYGLRMGELLCLRVQDIIFGRISELRVIRRAADPNDKRQPPPKVKRLSRQLALDSEVFTQELSEYIEVHREQMMEKGDAADHDYLIVSDEGEPLHLNTVSQFFRVLRNRYPDELPKNLTSKMMRHTFSVLVERGLRDAGYEEDHRRQTLAALRGDSSLGAQDTYVRAGLIEAADETLRKYHSELIMED